ncbi:DUF6875 domain-containing protein [Saccharothrix syringae]|uniref:DUF6875 domain-containing protein n=1 Tax=Saccharothrix syringae TaxID=103733 RepID=A0A5Q0H358_SACSY|nr:hypothetical protein [Saccharothrix syringae]QFZ20668.1 hypothetical protein EKG83_27630 [Saccharothrix syringae]
MLTVDLGESLKVVDAWLTDYISRPHRDIGRSGAVCPFVEPARRAGVVDSRVRLVGPSPSPALLVEVVRCSLDEYELMDAVGDPSPLRSLVVVLPDLPEDRWSTFDAAHAAVKTESVLRGLMIGQFHPTCTERSARNPEFEVSKSPVPLLAVRRMAVHDVLFLGERREWFEEYLSRFGARFRKPDRIDAVLYEAYLAACARHRITP